MLHYIQRDLPVAGFGVETWMWFEVIRVTRDGAAIGEAAGCWDDGWCMGVLECD